MLEKIPSAEEIELLIGVDRFKAWTNLCDIIDTLYDMEHIWNNGAI